MSRFPGAVELPIIGLQVVGKSAAVPLKSCDVKAALNGYVVGLDSTLRYVNDGTSPLEVLFRFPVDQSYAVVGLEAVIAGKKIKAQMKEKEEAKQVYDDAIASGFTAAFAEEKAGDIFSISLGNLPPKAEAEINLKLVGELPIDAEGAIRFSVPAVLKPRYTPIGSTDPLSPAQVDSAAYGRSPAVHTFEMTVTKEGVASVTSPTHKILEKQNDDSISVTLSEEDAKPLDKDLVVLVRQSNPHLPKAVCELGGPASSQRSYMGAPAVMLSFFPEFESKRSPCEFIFLVDRSGSMRGSFIHSASETLILFLKSIPSGCIFNIIGFGSSFRSLFPSSVQYNQENLDVAMQHAETLQADLGGTELFSPLSHIFSTPLTRGLPRQVFVLTDGSVSNTDACIAEVKKNAVHSRVFTFGIGSGASTALVNGLAKAGNGNAEFIKEGERMQPKVISSLKRALQPSVTDLEVDFQLPYGFDTLQAPDKIPTIFNGDKIVVYGIFKSKAASDTPLQAGLSGTATLKGQILNTPMTHSISFDIPAPPIVGEEVRSSTGFQMPVIHHLAAKSLISDWSNGYGWSSTALQVERKEETIKLSIESSVISEYTAFVAYDINQGQLIEGAIKVWDLTATPPSSSLNIMRKKGKSASHHSSALYSSRALPQRSGPPPGQPALATFASAPQYALKGYAGPPPPSGGSGPPPPPPGGSGPPPAPQYALMGFAGPPPPPGGSGPPPASASSYFPPPPAPGQGPPSAKYAPDLTIIISLQQAAGFWHLKDIADKVIKKEVHCPPGVSTDVWGTLLALSLLEERCAEKKDEWELIAMKADSWLESQTLPEGVTLASLREVANKVK